MDNDLIAMDAEEDKFINNDDDNDRSSVHYEQVRILKRTQNCKTKASVLG